MSDPVKEFEKLKAEIEEVKVKKLSWEREKQRLETEFEELKEKIKNDYGVELGEFGNAIKSLEEEIARDSEEIRKLLDEFKEKTKD